MKIKWEKISFILGFYLLFKAASAFALGSAGASAFAFLNNGFGARANGMGKAFIAVANDVSSIYWNPAGLVNLKQKEVIAQHSVLFSKLLYYDVLGYTQRITGIGNVGIGFITLNVPDITFYDDKGNAGSSFIDSENALLLSYGYKFSKEISLGGTLKTIFHRIYKYSGIGLSFDAAATYRFAYDLKFAVVLENILSTGIKFNAPNSSRSYAYPKLRLGVAYRGLRDATIAAGIDQQIYGDFYYYAGGEYNVLSYLDADLKLRAGLDNERVTLGFGIGYGGYSLDYAYDYSLSNNFLGNSSRISVSAKF